MRLRSLLVPLLAELDSTVPNLNVGGCGAVAIAICTVCKDFHPEVIYLHSDELCKVSDSAEHVVTRIGNFYYDSTGKFTRSQLLKEWPSCNLTKVPFSYLVRAVNRSTLWNHRFCRYHLSTVAKIANKYQRN